MASSNPDIRVFAETARRNPSLKWYAIADSAQHRALPGVLVQEGQSVRCLLGGSQDTPVAQQSPHLVALCSPLAKRNNAWSWIGLNGKSNPCVTVLAATLSFDALFGQLADCTTVVLPDSFSMFFGFWDPAILGTLVGQEDDLTLHVRGPVLSAEQRAMLTVGVDAWWYWDRTGEMHSVRIGGVENGLPTTPLTLTQEQVDDLVEASVPDHVLYYLELNQPLLISEVPSTRRYEIVRQALSEARDLGLLVMRDLVNFTCLKLIYNDRMRTDPVVVNIFERLRGGTLSFHEALKTLP